MKTQTMDRTDQSGDWADRLSPDLATIESIALTAYAHLPQEFRTLTADVQIIVADFPTDEISDDLGLETPFDLLGLFEGRGIAERWNPGTGEQANRITLYRRAILDYWSENEEALGDIITHVLIHELGHHFGLSDSDMEAIEEAAE
jgi:predicted Zn-dependent protease with MMP-like domain